MGPKPISLANLVQDGLELRYAYGDLTSDFAAYANAGVDPSRIFALRAWLHDKDCQDGIYAECVFYYKDHIDSYIAVQPDAESWLSSNHTKGTDNGGGL